ncbi:PIN-like domain-containing protein [Mesorhizobium sp. L-8-10]|uniref:PIN-like domain-containing protein n=1 Tax=Mesorhizobium sp. L-8-10 TaxID=2744523 RepID=UPI001925260B
MNVLFDNCTSPVLATTLHGFIQHFGHAAYHIKDVPGLSNGRHSADLEWKRLFIKSQRRSCGDGRIFLR